MNPLTVEWVEKAEGDYITAGRELRSRVSPNMDAVCFHSQQVAEKYLKAVLQEIGLPIPKIHKLTELFALCLKIDSSYQKLYVDLTTLEDYAVIFRYPGAQADKSQAKAAYKAAKVVRNFVRDKLGLL
jgi:HEPN domain-containing protein